MYKLLAQLRPDCLLCADFPAPKEAFFMSKNTKIAIIALVVLVLVIALLLIVWKSTRLEPTQGAKTVNIVITHMDGTEKKLVLHTDQEYLLAALQEQDQNLVGGYESAYGYTLDTVDGEFADAEQGQWWVFTKGGQWVDTAIDATVIQDGDSYEFSVYVS